MSLIELLVALSITGVAVAGLTEMSFLSADWINKFSNKVDIGIAARRAMEIMSKDLRCARNLGDCSETNIGLAPEFPSSQNPIYKLGLPNGAPPKFVLSNSILIAQIPVVDKSGWPTVLPTSIDQRHGPNVDTIVYEVVPDTDPVVSGIPTYLIRRSVFPGKRDVEVSTEIPNLSPVYPGQTILRGIVGPLDKVTGKPTIFQTLDLSNPNSFPGSLDSVYVAQLPTVGGVVINVELLHTQGKKENITIAVLRSEVAFRNRSISE